MLDRPQQDCYLFKIFPFKNYILQNYIQQTREENKRGKLPFLLLSEMILHLSIFQGDPVSGFSSACTRQRPKLCAYEPPRKSEQGDTADGSLF